MHCTGCGTELMQNRFCRHDVYQDQARLKQQLNHLPQSLCQATLPLPCGALRQIYMGMCGGIHSQTAKDYPPGSCRRKGR